jgi:hypothetical protein
MPKMRRGDRPKKPKKPVVEWERLLLVEKAAAEIIEQCHPLLERAKILAIGRPGRAGESKCDGIVKLRPARSAEKVIAKEDIGDVAYILEVRSEPYAKLTADGRKRRLDHALCHGAGLDEKGRWFTVDHEVEEFVAILKRHGAPDDNPSFGDVVKQMSLFAKGKA